MTRHRRVTSDERPLRRFGQNFLVDRTAARRLVDIFDPGDEDVVVEIGAGRGALTELLAPRAARLIAVEIDKRRLEGLARLLEPHPNAELLHADALEMDWQALASEASRPLRVIGNLPYNVGTAIVRRLVAVDGIADVQVVLQLEVVERICSPPARRSYGPLSIVCSLRASLRKLMTLGPGAFRPRPRVRSAALSLRALPAPPLASEEVDAIERWLFRGFAARRKTLAGNLAEHRERVRSFLASRGLPEDARAEAVPAQDWLDLARLLERSDSDSDPVADL